MAKQPNYGQERANRERAQQAKQQEKVRRREEEAAKRKAHADEPKPGDTGETS